MPPSITRIFTVVGLVLIFAVSAAGLASAAIPDSNTKVYTACVSSSGSIRLINYQAGKRCTRSEKTRTWNQRGLTGATGPQGPKGDTGDQGLKGDTGDQGPKGDTGDQGLRGDTGDQGPKGDTGDQGPKGDTGDQGAQGPPGVSGYEVVSQDFVMTLSVEYGTSTVDCPLDKVPIGGGYDYSDLFTKNVSQKYQDFIGASYPTANGWAVKWYHGIDNLAINFTVYAVCAAAS